MELNTGFSEITVDRLQYEGTNPWYLEIALTGRCNFKCTYCNRFEAETTVAKVYSFLDSIDTLKHIQVTGGEPTIRKDFESFINRIRPHTLCLGVSTNGSADLEFYESLPIDMFSISLDDYDNNILESRGYQKPTHIKHVITELAKVKYVNVGLVVDHLNVHRIESIIDYILSLGVHDIKLSISTRTLELMPEFSEYQKYEQYPILSYRVKNFRNKKPMRGYPVKKCYISEHDVTIVGDKHYPCLVYFREGGNAIGDVNSSILQDRIDWVNTHNCLADTICSKYCMDFKCDFNAAREQQLIFDQR